MFSGRYTLSIDFLNASGGLPSAPIAELRAIQEVTSINRPSLQELISGRPVAENAFPKAKSR